MINRTPPGSPNLNNSDENTAVTTSTITQTTATTTSTFSTTTSIESRTSSIFPIESEILNNLSNTLKLRKKAANLRNVDPQRYDSEIQSYILQLNSLIMTSTEQAKNLSFDQVIKLIRKTFSGEKTEYRSFRENIQIAFEVCQPSHEQLLLQFVLTRLEGEARAEVRSLIKQPRTWMELIEFLDEKYADTQTFDQLVEELLSIQQAPTESVTDFASKIKLLIWKCKETGVKHNELTKDVITSMIDYLGRRRFINKCTPRISNYLNCLSDLNTLPIAITRALQEEQRLIEQNTKGINKNLAPTNIAHFTKQIHITQ